MPDGVRIFIADGIRGFWGEKRLDKEHDSFPQPFIRKNMVTGEDFVDYRDTGPVKYQRRYVELTTLHEVDEFLDRLAEKVGVVKLYHDSEIHDGLSEYCLMAGD